jgi:hypothetical protein
MLKIFARSVFGLILAFPAFGATIRVPDEVAALVVPVLEAQARSAERDSQENAEVLEHVLGQVIDREMPTTTEALVVLLGFYVGEHPDEEVACELVARGQKAVQSLERYAQATVIVPGAQGFSIRPNQGEYQIVLRRIHAHEKCVHER